MHIFSFKQKFACTFGQKFSSFQQFKTLNCNLCGRYVTASVYQMLRGAEILFSAIFAVTFLKRSLNKRHYIGIAFCLVGISMVGASSLLKPTEGGSSDAGKVLLGMVLIVVAQARQHSSYSFFTLFVISLAVWI